MRYLIYLPLLLCLSCAAGKKHTASSAGDTSALPGTSWQIKSLPGFELENTARPVVIFFEDSTTRFGGYAGCNTFGGEYRIEGKTLNLDKIISTKMACNVGLQTEYQLMKAMSETDNFDLANQQLTLKSGEKTIAVFGPYKKD